MLALAASLLLAGRYVGTCQPTPIAHYTFDSGNAEDASGNNLHGTLVGSAQIITNNTRPFAPAGNQVLSLDGVDLDANSSHVHLGTPAQLNFSGGNATFAAWVFVDVTKSHNAVFSQGEWKRAASLTIKGDTSPANQLWAAGTSSGTAQRSDGAISVAQWTHVAATWTVVGGNTQIAFYTNGVATGFAEGGSLMTGTLQSPVNGSAIGREWRDSTASNVRWIFDGLIDDVQLYNTALTAAEVYSLYLSTNAPPQILISAPANGATFYPTNGGIQFTATTVSPNSLPPANLKLFLNEADVSAALSISGSSTQLTAAYSVALRLNQFYTARAVVTDSAGRSATNIWSFDTANPSDIPPGIQLNLTAIGTARHTGDPSSPSPATAAIDGNVATFSETPDILNSFWEVEMPRPYSISRIELFPPAAPGYAGVADNLVLRVQDLRDRTLFQTTVTGGGSWLTNLPVPVNGRIIRFALENGQANGAGDHRVALGEVKVYGDPSPAFGPASASGAGKILQSSTSGTFSAAKAVDGNPVTYSETQNLTNSYWLMTFDAVRPIQRIEIVNRSDANAARLQGLTLRILDDTSNSVASTTMSNPGAGNNWTYLPPPGTTGRYLKIGLENGATNGAGDRIVTLAEVSVLTGTNVAVGADSYMTRSTDSLLPTTNLNDGNYSTYVQLHQSTVDGYFEVDLGQTRALYSMRAVSSDGMQSRTAHATASVFDETHELVFARHLAGSNEVFDVDLPGPVLARYVRIGLENKERTSPTGGTEWVFGLKELQAFGRASSEVGLLSISATVTQILAGASTQLHWQEEDLHQLLLFPGIGSVGSNTAASGLGTLSISPTNSTEYILVGSNYSGNFTRALSIQVNGQSLPARLSELVANSKLSLRDGYNEYPDWIELHNPNNTSLDLGGCGLSDDPALPMKWTFPGGVIVPPHGYLIVFASDRNTPYDVAGFLHANFSLDANPGESVVLTAPDNVTPVDFVTFEAQMEDLAYGRTLDGQWKFLEPTPGVPNVATGYEGWLQPLEFSHKRGWHTNAFSLVISNANPDSQVFWSTNGIEPTNLYTGPLTIASTTGVRAAVERDGYKSPRTKTHTFLFLDDILASSVMSSTYTQDPNYTNRLRQGLLELPTISINVPPAPNIVNAERPERAASVELLMPDGSDVQENCGVIHFGGAFGNGTGNPYAKRSYQLKFRKDYGAAKLKLPLFQGFDHGFLSRDSFDEIDLHAGNHDMTSRGFYLSHRFAADTMLDLGSLNPHGRFVHLYLNGIYWGQYDAHERLTDSFLSEQLGGAKEDYLTVKGNDNGPGGNFLLGVPDPEPPGRAAWETMRANRNSYAAVRDALDVTNLIDFMLVWNWGNAEAEYRAAGARIPGQGGFKFWLADADGHLRNQSGVASALTRNGTAISGPGLLFGALLAEGHPDFRTLLGDRIYKHFFNNGAMTPAANEARMNLRMNEITNSMVAECARWGSLGGRTPVNWQMDAQYARDNLFPYRNDTLLSYMRNAGWYPTNDVPTLNLYGGSVTNGFPLAITASGPGTIYYTLDGADPRLAGGGIAPSALVWSGGSLVLTSNTVVKLRLLNGSEWSALADATFLLAPLRQPAPGELVISEIHYNPAGADDYEFIELYNISTNLLDLTNVRLTDGVDFLFPNNFRLAPGGFTLVVEVAAAFDQRYRTNTSPYYYGGLLVAGVWSGQLNNAGERLTLVASNNVELAALAYEGGGSWPGRANGRGSSLELRSPAAAVATPSVLTGHLARGANWRSSALYHGSPGRLDATPRAMVINEVVSHTDVGVDWIELQNTTGAASTLSNYFLSDSYFLPFRYAFATNTTIAANAFLILDANQLGFGFGELASDILLIEASGTNILRFVDTTDIPAADQEEPFGRYTRSDAIVDFTELRAKTQAATNALPRIGPVVFSEIMYHPTNGNAEYVELVNITHASVPLYDPLRPTNRWELSDAVDFLFPSNQVLAPGAVAIICATNPATFRTQYGVSASVPVYGPWSGALNNAGEPLHLRRPGVPEPNGFVPYYRVDRVRYEPVSPWPTAADGGGASLERVTLEGYGNDPANWQASVISGTPGTFTGNRQPNLAADGNTTVTEGGTVLISVQGSDLDEPWQSVTKSGQSLPPGSAFDAETGEFSWSTTEADGPGVYSLRFIATDSGLHSLTRTQSVTVAVLESNRPPTLQFVSDLPYPALLALSLDLIAGDPDLPSQPLTFSGVGLPVGLTLNPNTGRISGSAPTQGVYPVSVSVSDNQSPALSASRSFNLTITYPFRVFATSGGSVPQFAFPTILGETYDIQYSYSLTSPNWTLLQHIPSAAGGLQNIPALPNSPAPQCFIRVLWVR